MQAISSIFHELENVPEPLMNSFVHLIVEASASRFVQIIFRVFQKEIVGFRNWSMTKE